MSKLMQGVVRFWHEEEGTEVVEWALVCGLIVAIGAAIFVSIGDGAAAALQAVADLFGKGEG
ncbi:hypothetical protein BZY95_02740 [Billgrantia desiderata SP1]|uniref:Flp family type IVb pilin n=1 Tax=Billgrantia desiderata TaxID=52021 RepID=UPI000A3788AB|nr:hypothetical protein [Halomonas desiderata]OUE46051.1 hypothetical protein BZY95_02740 [Halomonas desiderata SP1]